MCMYCSVMSFPVYDLNHVTCSLSIPNAKLYLNETIRRFLCKSCVSETVMLSLVNKYHEYIYLKYFINRIKLLNKHTHRRTAFTALTRNVTSVI